MILKLLREMKETDGVRGLRRLCFSLVTCLLFLLSVIGYRENSLPLTEIPGQTVAVRGESSELEYLALRTVSLEPSLVTPPVL